MEKLSTTEHCLAKINLTLHITGKRDDGYHTLHSIVAFATDVFDVLTIEESIKTTIEVTGPYASVVPQQNSLIAALSWLEKHYDRKFPLKIILEKNIPAGAGLGGGSANAAGLIRAVQRLYNLEPAPIESLVVLGADVPVCYMNKQCMMTGVGEKVLPYDKKIPEYIHLINPNIHCETGKIFQNFKVEDKVGDNHLLAPALRIEPKLERFYEHLLVLGVEPKMTGSGSTFFTENILSARQVDALEGCWLRKTMLQ